MNVDVKRSLQSLGMRFAAPLLDRARAFWVWWSGQIYPLLPAKIRDAIARRRQKLFIEAEEETLRLSIGSRGDLSELLSVPIASAAAVRDEMPHDVQQTILLLPAARVLSRSLTLPLAAEENLREVLGFEIDQHTPFPEDMVYYDYLVTERNAELQTLSLDLVYTRRDDADRLLNVADELGLDVDVVTSHSRDGSNVRAVNLLPQDRRRRRRVTIHRLNLALAACCLVLLGIAIAVPIVQKNRALEVLEEQVAAASAEAREGNQLRRELEKMAEASRFLFEKKRVDVMVVQYIEEVSRILPDHTFLTRLDLSETELQIQGQSTASSSLIAIIEGSPLFENASFRSPVVQVAGTDADRFHMSADIAREEAE